MNIFIIVFGILMCLAEIISVVVHLSLISEEKKLTPEEGKILYIKNNRHMFGVSGYNRQQNYDSEIIVVSPAALGL